MDIDSLIGEDHPARVIWAYVEELDLSELEDPIKAREGRPGHPAITPRLLLALWLYATSEGVGSARALARLCESHDAYRWLCGGVSVNYHTLADFRVGCGDLLDRLLSRECGGAGEGRPDRSRHAGAGRRAGSGERGRRLVPPRGDAGAASGAGAGGGGGAQARGRARSDASNQRIRAARERAARERGERVEAAQTALAEIKRQRKEREEKRGKARSRRSRAPPPPTPRRG